MNERFPRLAICLGMIENIKVEKENGQIKILRKNAYEEVRGRYDAETLKDNPTVRAYRDMYWKLNIDPTKTRPSGEALLRRVLHGNDLPNISTAVDAYNLASMRTIIPISGFDFDCLTPPFQVRFTSEIETFTGIESTEPLLLASRTLVLADRKQILCIYPYRDSDHSRIMMKTQRVVIVGYGAPGISPDQLREAAYMALASIKQASGGEIGEVRVFQSSS